MPPIGCSVIKLCMECIKEECKFVVLSRQPSICADNNTRIFDPFGRTIYTAKKCQLLDPVLPKSFVESSSGMSTYKIVKIGIGCLVAGVVIGWTVKKLWNFGKERWSQRRMRLLADSTASLASRSILTTSRTSLTTMLSDDYDNIPVYNFNEFLEMKFDESGSSENIPMLQVDNPMVINPTAGTSRARRIN